MKRKMLFIVLMLLPALVGPLTAGQKGKDPQMKRTFTISGNGPGYDLLRTLADDFGAHAGKPTFTEASDRWIETAKKLQEAGKVDAVFFKRYKQLAIVCKLVMIPDKEGILEEIIVRELNKFGVKPLQKDFRYTGIGSVAARLTEEIFDLKKYLDKS